LRNLLSLKDHICHLEKKLMEPEIRSNPNEIDKLLAEGFFEFGSSGSVWRREDNVGEGGIDAREKREMSLFDFELHPLSEEVVLATYRVYDVTRNHDTLRSSIWKLIDGSWQMFFHQGTIAK
jgi:hypothetical protein